MPDRPMPCGQCPAGTYAYGAVVGGVDLFARCETRRDALRSAPKCRTRPGMACRGCVDWIRAAEFPVDGERLLESLR